MKKIIYAFCIAMSLCQVMTSKAQTGWLWGKSDQYSRGTLVDVMGPAILDKYGNLFNVGLHFNSDSVSFGASTIYDTSSADNIIVTKADSNGNFLWASGLTLPASINGSSFPFSISTDTSGNLYLFGYYQVDSCTIGSITLYNPSVHRMHFLAKYAPDGHVDWAKNIMDSGWPDTVFALGEVAGAIVTDKANNVYIQSMFTGISTTIGTFTLTNSDVTGLTNDIYLAKLDSSGTVKWVRKFGGSGDDYCGNNRGFGSEPMAITSDGHVVISGQTKSATFQLGSTTFAGTSSDIETGMLASYIAETDSGGNSTWVKKLDCHIAINGITTDANRNIYFTGAVDSVATVGAYTTTWNGSTEMILAKMNSSGTVKWVKTAGNNTSTRTYAQMGFSVATDYCGNLWVSGSMGLSENMVFDSNVLNIISLSQDPSYFVEYDTNGNYQQSIELPTLGEDVNAIITDNKGNFYVGGDYGIDTGYGPLVFGTDTFADHRQNETFLIAKYKYDTLICSPDIENTQVAGMELNSGVQVYPNPAFNELTVSAGSPIHRVVISNFMGQTVFIHEYNADLVQIGLASLPPGFYMIKINNLETRKFVKE